MTGPRIRGKSVLLVEDEPGVASTLARLLAIDDHAVTIVENGLQALAKLREGKYDLILSDITMPGLDGVGLYREIARIAPRMARRFVFITGDFEHPETHEFIEASGVPLRVKPLTLLEIRRVVEQVLNTP